MFTWSIKLEETCTSLNDGVGRLQACTMFFCTPLRVLPLYLELAVDILSGVLCAVSKAHVEWLKCAFRRVGVKVRDNLEFRTDGKRGSCHLIRNVFALKDKLLFVNLPIIIRVSQKRLSGVMEATGQTLHRQPLYPDISKDTINQ